MTTVTARSGSIRRYRSSMLIKILKKIVNVNRHCSNLRYIKLNNYTNEKLELYNCKNNYFKVTMVIFILRSVLTDMTLITDMTLETFNIHVDSI